MWIVELPLDPRHIFVCICFGFLWRHSHQVTGLVFFLSRCDPFIYVKHSRLCSSTNHWILNWIFHQYKHFWLIFSLPCGIMHFFFSFSWKLFPSYHCRWLIEKNLQMFHLFLKLNSHFRWMDINVTSFICIVWNVSNS